MHLSGIWTREVNRIPSTPEARLGFSGKNTLFPLWNAVPSKCPKEDFFIQHSRYPARGFPGGSDGKESACSAGGVGSIPGSGRSPGGGTATHSKYVCPLTPMHQMPGAEHPQSKQTGRGAAGILPTQAVLTPRASRISGCRVPTSPPLGHGPCSE